MILHGDDIYNYKGIRYNLSSNVYNGFDHSGLFAHLAKVMPCVANYPEPTPQTLESMIAYHLGINADNVMVTNGATEAIYLIAQAHRGHDSLILQPTFAEYGEACRIIGIETANLPLSVVFRGFPSKYPHSTFQIPHSTFPIQHSSFNTDLAWLCNPNNPTGTVIPKDKLLNLIHHNNQTTFVIDQSYDRFTLCNTMTAPESVKESNVLILHSMTKEYAIPGLRLGYVIGNKKMLDNIRRYRMPWSVNALAIEAGKYLLEHDNEYCIDVETLISEAERTADILSKKGMIVTASDTHILLCQIPESGININGITIHTAAELKKHLATHYGILIRDASNFETLTPRHFRIAVQDTTTNNAFLSAITG